MLKFKYYTDAGHGWFAVKHKLLEALGIKDKISHYSYTNGQTAYLEEDCDATLLFNALKAKGLSFSYVEKHTTRSPIRGYQSYKIVNNTNKRLNMLEQTNTVYVPKSLLEGLINATYAVLSENRKTLKESPKLERLEELLTMTEELTYAEQTK